MKHSILFCCLLGWGLLLSSCSRPSAPAPTPQPTPTGPSQAALWLTTPDQRSLFAPTAQALYFQAGTSGAGPIIEVDTSTTFQRMEGFGYTLTGGSAELLHQLPAAARAAILQELFGTSGAGIGVSYLRLSIGASDLSSRVFTYDDPPTNQPDPDLAYFSLAPEEAALLPVLREILAINPEVQLLGSPWTAPPWMKTNGRAKGGSLQPAYYATYARYLVRYLQAMQAAGAPVAAITIQNEPLNPDNTPSMVMTAAEQARFIGEHLGPALRAAGLATKILLYDHNLDRPDYPLAILADARAAAYVEGSAFHLYAGSIETLSAVHAAFPTKGVYFTEQWIDGRSNQFAGDFGWHIRNLMIGAPRNWSRTVLEWNLAADQNFGPHTDGGCTSCLGALTINGADIARNPAYYIIAHASKFVRPGSVRVGSSVPGALPNVAYQNPAGQKVLLVQNSSTTTQSFGIGYRGKVLRTSLPAGAVGTYVW